MQRYTWIFMTEADTCRDYITPALESAGWKKEPHSLSQEVTFTDGRVVTLGKTVGRKPQRRADYLLRYTRDYPIAVVEAKVLGSPQGTGLQQAKAYAEILGLNFAYATDGEWWLEYDYTTGLERELTSFPTPAELWERERKAKGLADEKAKDLLTPFNLTEHHRPRYYQEIAINRVVAAVLKGERRILLTMATGTGKTFTAFQVAWKLWSTRWNKDGEYRRPRILFLADLNILVDDPKDKMFAPFGDARWKISGEINTSRDMYFAIYQAIADREGKAGLYQQYPRDFFDLIIVDEAHRGSARDDSNWRSILEHFEPAYQLGMTATPLREDNRDTYAYFGNPIYQYSLRQGIEDGFLAPYRVHRVVTSYDALGWRPVQGQTDRYGQAIPDKEYTTKDFEREVALKARTEAIAKHLTDHLKKTDRFAKTIIFCVDQEHADEMRRALNNLNADLAQQYPDYVARVTSDDGVDGKAHLSNFQDVEKSTPVILTTSKLLSTGVDAPTCKNVVLARVVGTMTEFKQIIGRGTRLRTEYGKYYFNILDYTGSATEHFADPEFDGYPAHITKEEMGAKGETVPGSKEEQELEQTDTLEDVEAVTDPQVQDNEGIALKPTTGGTPDEPQRRKFYFDGGSVEIVAQMISELDSEGNQLRMREYTDYSAEKLRTLFQTPEQLRVAVA
jgi:type I restriction enzyme R subunit